MNDFNPVRVMSSAVDSFRELPQALVKARIALRLSQKALADHPGMQEQQIQRYESTDYQSASMSRLHDVVQALFVSVRLEFKDAKEAVPEGTREVSGVVVRFGWRGIHVVSRNNGGIFDCEWKGVTARPAHTK